jgi:hypothetical protein
VDDLDDLDEGGDDPAAETRYFAGCGKTGALAVIFEEGLKRAISFFEKIVHSKKNKQTR